MDESVFRELEGVRFDLARYALTPQPSGKRIMACEWCGKPQSVEISGGGDADAAFEKYVKIKYKGADSDEWHDAPVSEVFKDGFNLGRKSVETLDKCRIIDLHEFSKGWSDWLTVEAYGVSIIKTEALNKALKMPSPNKADVPEGFVLCDKSIVPLHVIDAGEKFLNEYPYRGLTHNALALAIHTEMLLAYDSLPPQDSHHE